MAFVIKTWSVNEQATGVTPNITIKGRAEGLLSWFLALIKVDPTLELIINSKMIQIVEGSLAGNKKVAVPMTQVSSAYFGYTKPWKMALLLTVCLLPVFFLGLLVGPLYYFLNKQLQLGISTSAGETFSIAFKRSIIEGQSINEEDGYKILDIISNKILDKNS